MKPRILLGLLVLLTHGIFYHPAGWNQTARLDGVFAFVEPGSPDFRTLRIDSLKDGGGGRNTGTGDWARGGDHYYSNKPPGSTLLGIVAYWPIQVIESHLGVHWKDAAWTNLNGYFINLFVSVMFSALGVILLREILTGSLGMSSRDALLVCAAYGWGTLIFPFDATLWGHTTAAALVMLGLHGMLRGSRAGSLQAGFALGAAVLVDNVATIGLAVCGLYYLLSPTRRRDLGWLFLSALLPLGVLLVYQRVIFGGFFRAPTLQQRAEFQSAGLLGGVFGSISPTVLVKLLFSPYRGAFLFMPVLAFCIPGTIHLWRRDRALAACCWLGIVGTLLLISSFNGWHGGYSAGPRYLIPSLPFWALLLPPFSALRSWARWLFGGLLTLSIANALVFCAWTTIVPEDNYNPLYGDAYGKTWREPWSLAPVIYRRK